MPKGPEREMWTFGETSVRSGTSRTLHCPFSGGKTGVDEGDPRTFQGHFTISDSPRSWWGGQETFPVFKSFTLGLG